MAETIAVLYQNFKDALVDVLLANARGFVSRSELWKARTAVMAHKDFDRGTYERVILQAHEDATKLLDVQSR